MLANFLAKYKSSLSLTFVIIFSLSGIIWQSNFLARSTASTVEILDFFTATFRNFSQGILRFINSYESYESMRQERNALHEELRLSREFQLRIIELEEQNRRFRNLLGLPALTNYPIVQAEVISTDPDNWFRTVIINRGSEDKIRPYMPVIAAQAVTVFQKNSETGEMMPSEILRTGVVGKVIQVNKNSSRILTILDQYSRIGVMVKKSGHWALLQGRNPYASLPQLEYLSLSIFLKEGDQIITSGAEKGIFPQGLPIGRVAKNITRLGNFQRAEIEPVLDFSRLDMVMVILKKQTNPEFQSLETAKLRIPTKNKILPLKKTKGTPLSDSMLDKNNSRKKQTIKKDLNPSKKDESTNSSDDKKGIVDAP